MILLSRAKLPTTGRRIDIGLEHYSEFINTGLITLGLALLLLYAHHLQQKGEGSAGWLDFFCNAGKLSQVFILVSKSKRAFTPAIAVAVIVGGIIIWITLDVMMPEEKEEPKGPLELAPPAEVIEPPQ